MATSSGGTLAGIAIANYLAGKKLRVHGFCVANDSNYFYKHIDKALKEYQICDVEARNICDIVDGYVGESYGEIAVEDLGIISLLPFFISLVPILFLYSHC